MSLWHSKIPCTYAERWQKPDPDNPGHTIGQSVMEQFSFRYGVNELWLGVGVTAAWTIVMAAATFLALIFLNRGPFLLSSNPCTIFIMAAAP